MKNDGKWTHQGLGFFDMLITEEELAIQIAQVNRIKVDDVDFAKAGKQEVLEQFAADATSAHEQYSRLYR